jgi:hypothetical protein
VVINGIGREWPADLLVAYGNHGKPPNRWHKVAHLNGDHTDNRAENLAYYEDAFDFYDRMMRESTAKRRRAPYVRLRPRPRQGWALLFAWARTVNERQAGREHGHAWPRESDLPALLGKRAARRGRQANTYADSTVDDPPRRDTDVQRHER